MATINWDEHRWETDFTFRDLKTYLETIEKQLETIREEARARINTTPPPGMTREEYAEWYSEYEVDISSFEERYERDFPSKSRYSFLVLLHIVLEDRLRATCNEIQKRRNLPIMEKDLKGAALERANSFLKKVAGINYNNQTDWQNLRDLQSIRDCIVHTNGRIDESRDQRRINDLCKKNIGISSVDGALAVDKSYCIFALEAILTYFTGLLDCAGFGSCKITFN